MTALFQRARSKGPCMSAPFKKRKSHINGGSSSNRRTTSACLLLIVLTGTCDGRGRSDGFCRTGLVKGFVPWRNACACRVAELVLVKWHLLYCFSFCFLSCCAMDGTGVCVRLCVCTWQ